MNILFLYGSAIDPEKGGIQRVTEVLSKSFINEQISIIYLSLLKNSKNIDNKRQLFLPNEEVCFSEENIAFFLNTLEKYNIDIVINQSGMDPKMSNLAYTAKQKNVKLISCIHNSFLSPIQNFESTYYNTAKNKGLAFMLPITRNKTIKNILLWSYRKKYKKHYAELYKYSDKIVLLSDNFTKELEFFLDEKISEEKVLAISNPTSFTVTEENNKYLYSKKKQVLYVGRVDVRQKRVDLLIDIWTKLEQRFPDWCLKIVGDGPDLHLIKQRVQNNNLSNIEFVGFKNPIDSYKESSIFCMTSAYEGFGIVLVEAMTYGTVPFAFDSYASASDIITSDIDGVLIPPFNTDLYAQKMAALMEDQQALIALASSSLNKAKHFTIAVITKKWIDLMNSLQKN